MVGIVIESKDPFEIHYEDNGAAAIGEVAGSGDIYIRVHSYLEDEQKDHLQIEQLVGHKLRVTIEMVD
jgi:aromatic ring-cleaving dioxygenase